VYKAFIFEASLKFPVNFFRLISAYIYDNDVQIIEDSDEDTPKNSQATTSTASTTPASVVLAPSCKGEYVDFHFIL
jgi:hypothetical protein